MLEKVVIEDDRSLSECYLITVMPMIEGEVGEEKFDFPFSWCIGIWKLKFTLKILQLTKGQNYYIIIWPSNP